MAFHPGHLVPGIDVTNDPLLQVRLFSYLDTQITRLGGPNFGQLPINRPQAPVNDMLRDGMHQTAVHGGVAPYRPNSLDGGCPFLAGAGLGRVHRRAGGSSPRPSRSGSHPASFDDHFSQARLFFRSLTPVEQDHVIQAYTFELGKCYEKTIRRAAAARPWPTSTPGCAPRWPRGWACRRPRPPRTWPTSDPSPALSQLGETWPVAGRVVGIVADGDSDLAAVGRPQGPGRGRASCRW